MRIWRRSSFVLVIAAAFLIALTGLALGERVQAGNIVIDVEGGFHPTTLPKHRFAPISLSGSGDISTADGSLPPPAHEVEIDWDRNGLLTTNGLPRCSESKLENTTTPAAMQACRKALVGTGFASGQVAFPDQAPFPASSKVLAFNGVPRGGHPVLLLHAYAYVPAPTTFVVPVDITKIHEGRYGYHSSLIAPVIAGGYGVVTHFDLTINRRYSVRGRKLSYLAARCPDGRLQARGTVSFMDGTSLSATVFRPCHGRG
jgi:hypothetical protein